MKKSIVLFLILSCSNLLFGQEAHNELLPAKDLQADFVILKQSLEKIHPDLYLYTNKSKMDSVFSEIESSINEPASAINFYRNLLPLNRLIGNNHTKILPPESYDVFIKKAVPRFPFSFYYRNDTLYVEEDSSEEYKIKEGSVVTKINGRSAIDLFREMVSYIPTDGYNKTQPEKRASKGFSRNYTYFFGTPDLYTLSYIDSEGKEQEVEIKGLPVNEILSNRRIQKTDPHLPDYSFNISNGIGVMTIKSFQIQKANHFKSFVKKSFSSIQKEKAAFLIIDVRDNFGGYPEAAYEIISYLISKPLKPTKSEYALVNTIPNADHFEKDFFYKHFHKQKLAYDGQFYQSKSELKFEINPKKNSFTGPLYLLINENSSSTTAMFLGLISSYCEATFIGNESGSSPVTQVANDILTLILPHSKVKARIPVIKSEMEVNIENTGQGLIPDHAIIPSIDHILNGKDIVKDKAFEMIEASRKSRENN